jgi:hypothetical protein
MRLRLWEVARAVLAESEDGKRPVALVPASLTTLLGDPGRLKAG